MSLLCCEIFQWLSDALQIKPSEALHCLAPAHLSDLTAFLSATAILAAFSTFSHKYVPSHLRAFT